MNLFAPILNLIWIGLFVAALYSHSHEAELWSVLWTCGMIGFFVGCLYKTQQHDIERATEPWLRNWTSSPHGKCMKKNGSADIPKGADGVERQNNRSV